MSVPIKSTRCFELPIQYCDFQIAKTHVVQMDAVLGRYVAIYMFSIVLMNLEFSYSIEIYTLINKKVRWKFVPFNEANHRIFKSYKRSVQKKYTEDKTNKLVNNGITSVLFNLNYIIDNNQLNRRAVQSLRKQHRFSWI